MRYRIVRTSSKPGGAVRTVHAGKANPGDTGAPTGWGAGGRILFERFDPPGEEGIPTLYSVDASGGKPERVAFPSCESPYEGQGLQCWPEAFILSADRKYAAAMTDSGGDPHIPESIGLLKLRPGRDPLEVPTQLYAQEFGGGVYDWILGFSPDGRQLVFSRAPWDVDMGETGPPVLMAVALDGSAPVPLTQSGIPGASLVPPDAQEVQWSRDGRWVAYVEHASLEVVPTTGASAPRVLETNVLGNDALPGAWGADVFSWSPTSDVIAYTCCFRNPQFVTVRPDGTHRTDLLQDRRLAYIWDFDLGGPQWSPDGSRLLFLARGIGHRTVHVWTIRSNGHGLNRMG